ncbi:hypothetical protein GYMLUDRAFT_113194, partial [Collybiopsis luxurians FD-317 M1]
EPPHLIPLDENSQCACHDGQQASYDPSCPKLVCQATLYTTVQAFVVDIELQVCPRCPTASRKHVGPDPRDIGIFNYNNTHLFSHKLVNKYISAFTTSETPIDPWIEQVSRRYQETAYGKLDGIAFVGGELFRVAWFLCVWLMDLEPRHPSFKGCLVCKETPRNLICNGVSIAFGWKQVNSNLEPPTAVGTSSVIQTSKLCQSKEWLPNAGQRKQLWDWLQ